MEYRYKPEDVPHYRRTQERIQAFAEKGTAEIFKWLGWATAIAAVQVIDIRTKSSWLQIVSFALSLLLVMRVQWFLGIGLKHPEETQPDGSLVVKFQFWKILASIPATALAWCIAFGAASLIAESDLLPPTAETVQSTPKLAPQAPPIQTPSKKPAPTRPQKQSQPENKKP